MLSLPCNIVKNHIVEHGNGKSERAETNRSKTEVLFTIISI